MYFECNKLFFLSVIKFVKSNLPLEMTQRDNSLDLSEILRLLSKCRRGASATPFSREVHRVQTKYRSKCICDCSILVLEVKPIAVARGLFSFSFRYPSDYPTSSELSFSFALLFFFCPSSFLLALLEAPMCSNSDSSLNVLSRSYSREYANANGRCDARWQTKHSNGVEISYQRGLFVSHAGLEESSSGFCFLFWLLLHKAGTLGARASLCPMPDAFLFFSSSSVSLFSLFSFFHPTLYFVLFRLFVRSFLYLHFFSTPSLSLSLLHFRLDN